MADYRERTAQRIRREAAKHGESPADLAHALQIHPSTAERWFRAERTPQPRLRKQLAAHWELSLDELEPDLEAEGREVRDQLDRIEEALEKILSRLPADAEKELDADLEREAQKARARDSAAGRTARASGAAAR